MTMLATFLVPESIVIVADSYTIATIDGNYSSTQKGAFYMP